MPRLDDTAVEEGLQHLPGWERRGNQIVKSFVREDFAQAMVFVNEVATAADAAGGWDGWCRGSWGTGPPRRAADRPL